MSDFRAPKARAASVTEMTEYVLPQHGNRYGNVFGGQIMAWVDLCGAICAERHAGKPCVTVFVDDLWFKGAVKVGQVVLLRAQLTAVFTTSMEIEVKVQGEDASTGKRSPTLECRMTFVAMGEDGRPARVPPLLIESEEDRRGQAEGEERKKGRLGKR